MIGIIDYGMGNIHSVQKALESQGGTTFVTNKPYELPRCEKLVLPGVGAFDDAVYELKTQNLITAILTHIRNKKVFLGICLGMQILFERSQEAKKEKGLGVLAGAVRKFTFSSQQQDIETKFKVPHMGWNQLNIKLKNCPLLKDLSSGSYVYFCHSYYPEPFDESVTAATTDYGMEFSSIVWRDNVYGVQFHPEKSQSAGLKILRNFVGL